MAKKQPEPVALQRPQTLRRRFRWWALIPLALVLLIAAGLIWLFQFSIQDTLSGGPTLPPAPPGASGGQAAPGVLYQTNFDDPAVAAEWEIFNDGFISSEIKDGQLVVAVNALTDTSAQSGLNYTFDDFVLDVDATKLDGPDDNGITVVFRLTDKDNYNRFDISSDGYYAVSRVREGVPATVSDWHLSPAILTGGATNHIRITAIGDTFRFEVNDTVLWLCVTTDPAVQPLWDPNNPDQCLGGALTDTWLNGDILRGKIGLGAQGFVGYDGQNSTPAVATIGFDNLVIKTPNAP